ncbi:formimidoylglutamate deiminase [Sphingosinithalassobacter portus]|uniref:formimidoylglutamate deiminase n=1 Tax=Stakelama portus TaxID=2676234 RepID=UPI000D6E686F|nr:formimidoylglutamate deiminase [Sphingosinithalassobacter portus]
MALWFERALLEDGWRDSVRVTLAGDTIADVAPGAAPQPGDQCFGPALPGIPNVHSHGFQRGMAGLAERAGDDADSFWTWREAMYRFVDRLDPEGFAAIAALAYAEMLESGFTAVGEFHYLHHAPDGRAYAAPARMAQAVVEAASETGIGLSLLPVFYAHSGFGGAPPSPSQRRFVHDCDSFARLIDGCRTAVSGLDGAVLGVAPHSLRAVTPDELADLAALVPDGPIHIHVAEQQAEVDACLAWSGRRPVAFLLDTIAIDPRWCLVHATHVDDAELTGIARSGAVVGLCPITEANLGDGLFPARAFLEQGGRIGIGSDSNVEIDAAGELRLLEYGQRLAHGGRNLLAAGPGRSTGRNLYDAARTGGAQALGRIRPAIAPGAVADIVALRADAPALVARPGDALIDSWVFAGGRGVVESVWSRGRRCVSGGRHVARDAIAARYRQTLGKLLD